MIVAMLALFVAMGGTAIAASSILITGKQIKNSSITGADVKNKSLTPKDFRGSVRGARGAAGPSGPPGPNGATGAPGAPGSPGPFPDGDMPAGKTVRGTYGMAGFKASASDPGRGVDSISFTFRFSAPPVSHVITLGGTPPPECPGTAAVPEALAGHLCVYEGAQLNSGSLAVFTPETAGGAARTGAILRIFGTVDGADFFSVGSWAAKSA